MNILFIYYIITTYEKTFPTERSSKPVIDNARELLAQMLGLGIPRDIAERKLADHQVDPGLKDAAELTQSDHTGEGKRTGRNVEY